MLTFILHKEKKGKKHQLADFVKILNNWITLSRAVTISNFHYSISVAKRFYKDEIITISIKNLKNLEMEMF